MAYDELVFNPKAYKAVCEKKDAKAFNKKTGRYQNGDHDYHGKYFDGDAGFGKIWDAVNDYRSSRDWG